MLGGELMRKKDYPKAETYLRECLTIRESTQPDAWSTFVTRYQREMAAPEKVHLLRLLAALSATTDFSVGCYCADETRCHRSVLRALLAGHGAVLA